MAAIMTVRTKYSHQYKPNPVSGFVGCYNSGTIPICRVESHTFGLYDLYGNLLTSQIMVMHGGFAVEIYL